MDYDGAIAEVRAASKRFNEALRKKDKITISGMMHEAYSSVFAEGQTASKKEALAIHLQKSLTYDTMLADDPSIRSIGDMAVEQGRLLVIGNVDGQPFHYMLKYTSVWVKEKSGWRLLSEHECTLGKDEERDFLKGLLKGT